MRSSDCKKTEMYSFLFFSIYLFFLLQLCLFIGVTFSRPVTASVPYVKKYVDFIIAFYTSTPLRQSISSQRYCSVLSHFTFHLHFRWMLWLFQGPWQSLASNACPFVFLSLNFYLRSFRRNFLRMSFSSFKHFIVNY